MVLAFSCWYFLSFRKNIYYLFSLFCTFLDKTDQVPAVFVSSSDFCQFQNIRGIGFYQFYPFFPTCIDYPIRIICLLYRISQVKISVALKTKWHNCRRSHWKKFLNRKNCICCWHFRRQFWLLKQRMIMKDTINDDLTSETDEVDLSFYPNFCSISTKKYQLTDE